MIRVEVSQASPEPSFPPSLADLSRNASVISSSSSSDSTSSLILNAPRPRPIRTFSAPRVSTSPQTHSRNPSRPPAYLTAGLGLRDVNANTTTTDAQRSAVATRARSQSRNRTLTGSLGPEDFKFGEELGEGSYSTVKHATHLGTGKEYAIKILDKGHLRRYRKMETALAEKNTLVRLGSGHPGIVRLHLTFQDEWSLFFVLDLATNGEMQSRISRMGSLSILCARYYSAQIVDALDYMHLKGVIHRDLKPENLLLDDAFRIKITDFGTGKLLEPGMEKAKTFVGTAQYVSPELLEANETSKSSDLWALGCIVYQMVAGRFAFTGLSEYLTWQKIKQLEYTFPEGFDHDAKDLVQKLIVRDPSQRLGAGAPDTLNSMEALRDHPFFASINWKTLWTDSPPPLESGLLKREPPSAAKQQEWEDTWDDMADSDGDGIRWADDAEGPSYIMGNGYGNVDSAIDPRRSLDVIPSSPESSRAKEGELLEEDTDTVMGHDSPPSASATAVGEPTSIDVPVVPNTDAASTASSSDGSPTEKLGAALEAMKAARGRNRAQTPLQGNVTTDTDWSSLLLPDEVIVFTSRVEERAVRRRASRLIPINIPVSQTKGKNRQLILTSHRLVCVKQRDRGTLSLKCQLTLQTPIPTIIANGKDREKDRAYVVSVEKKTDREFVVLTSGKSQTYAAADGPLASSWIEKITAAIQSSKQSRP